MGNITIYKRGGYLCIRLPVSMITTVYTDSTADAINLLSLLDYNQVSLIGEDTREFSKENLAELHQALFKLFYEESHI